MTTLIVGWFVVGVLALLVWVHVGRRLDAQDAANARDVEGQRALAIADAYRRLAATTRMDGEAWTYADAAAFWDSRARAMGVERRPRSAQSLDPTPSQAAVVSVPPVGPFV